MTPLDLTAAPRVELESLREIYCRKHHCAPEDFCRRIFWRALYPHAWLVGLVAGHRAERFAVDRALIDYCGRLTSLEEIDAELAEFISLRNQNFVRQRFRVRVSSRRLKKLAANYLAR